MKNFILCFGVCLCLSPALLAWDFKCAGEKGTKIKLSLSAQETPKLKYNNENLHVVNIEKEQQGQGFRFFGYVNSLEYSVYSVLIEDPEAPCFETFLTLKSSSGDEIAKITCVQLR